MRSCRPRICCSRAHAEIDAQPVLEIYADEVKAAHGATVGQLDERALFYLRSRGIDPTQARAMLIDAFCREISMPTSPMPICANASLSCCRGICCSPRRWRNERRSHRHLHRLDPLAISRGFSVARASRPRQAADLFRQRQYVAEAAVVIEATDRFYRQSNANVSRAVHTLGEEATAAYEATRGKLARFVNAPSRDEVILTSGTTQAINRSPIVLRCHACNRATRSWSRRWSTTPISCRGNWCANAPARS